jgi:VIT family
MPTSQSSPAPAGIFAAPSFVARHLDPSKRLSETLVGLVMALTFTLGARYVIEAGPSATKKMLLGILGCNIAWGLIDGAMHVLSCTAERSRKARLLQSTREAANEEDALAILEQELDARLAPLTPPAEITRLGQVVLKRLENIPVERTRPKKEDIFGAFAVFFLVFLSTIPAALPFLVFGDRFLAVRISNLLLLAMLFLVGYRWARVTHGNPWIFGSSMLLVGMIMVGIDVALGGK